MFEELKKQILLEKKVKDYEKVLENIYKELPGESLHDNYKRLSLIYNFVKNVTSDFVINGKVDYKYKLLKDLIERCEDKLTNIYITESSPIIKKCEITDSKNTSKILDYIVYKTREQLSMCIPGGDIRTYHLTNMCTTASTIVCEVCESLGIWCEVVKIEPGYTHTFDLYNGSGYHYFNIVSINGEKYIIDCTYRQFFTLNANNLDRLGVVDASGCKPGRFMLMTKERLELAKDLLKLGYVKLNANTLKTYLDGFTLSFRNGLYYEVTHNFSFKTIYRGIDYEHFLKGQDSQLKHEGLKVLGFQKTPNNTPLIIKNHDIE